MKFSEALVALEQGLKVRLPGWKGYWKVVDDAWGRPNILVFAQDGTITTTPFSYYMFATNWELAP